MSGVSGAQSGVTEPGTGARKKLTRLLVIIAIAFVVIVGIVVYALASSGDGADENTGPGAKTPAGQLKEAPQSDKLGSNGVGGGE